MVAGMEILEQDLLQLRGLVDSIVTQRYSQVVNSSLPDQIPSASESLEDSLEILMSQALESIFLAIGEWSKAATAALDGVARFAPSLAPNVTIRALVPPITQQRESVTALFPERAEVRLAALSGHIMVIADRDSTLLSSSSSDPTLIGDMSVATKLRAFLDAVWSTAQTLDQHLRLPEQTLSRELRGVLGCLQEGFIDELAARKLAMSVRTYRRYVADIMALLGANSRFQAGVRAVEMGLLPTALNLRAV